MVLQLVHLTEANYLIRYVTKLQHRMIFERPQTISPAMVTRFPGGSFSINTRRSWGQRGVVSVLRLYQEGHMDVYHMMTGLSFKLRRIYRSSYGAEILVSTESDGIGVYIQTALRSRFPTFM